ncbi:DNA polymerase epsilon subunit 2-like [Varroa jacobsoni]|uniref:DNA polymerase epsilon subunit n=1 Tax=Varroa destructor TaxID=109461 RepID=A0A7M7JTN9_VARDE|nr:DNA polymerase epsilon subunit 2-like [Varroa destructor]XP_022656972.1 DNA polymerase epsilon subunit 2-like [Varroa destructor]XP_022700860.1 DNA polymerase epsilon subunit 2-like [Varroa jacobsoni]
MSNNPKLKVKIFNSFQVQGLTLRRESSQYLEQILGRLEPDQQVDWINQIITWLQGQCLESALISKDQIVACIKQCSSISEQQQQVFHIISAFDVPAFSYNNDRKKFMRIEGKRQLFPVADAKAELYCERYKIVQQRTLRHKLFAAPTAASMLSSSKRDHYKLCSCESLIGMTNKANRFVVVLGMLTQLKEGKLFLEDPTGSVQLDLSKASFSQALITEGSIVLAEGTYDDKMFNVQAIGFAPAEPAKTSREYFGSVNYFAGDAVKCMKTDSSLKESQHQLEDYMLVILSDVWLDDVKTMERLKILFTGYNQCSPSAFILMGNFLRNSLGFQDVGTLKECFKQLADLITQFPDLMSRSRFIFVPGNRDPLTTKVIPRPPLPKVVTEYFSMKIPQSTFTSNPARIQLYTQEIILFREDLISKMCRNSVHVPWEPDGEVQLSQLYVKNLVGNAHLCALPTHIAPVLWQWDHALWLYPTPDLVVCADKHEPFTISQNECLFTNPGQFTKGDFCFKVYLPGQKKVEDSQICEPE